MITLRQPYTFAVVNGIKTVESRDSRPFHEGPVLVVAASRPDLDLEFGLARPGEAAIPAVQMLPRRVASGVVDIVGCVTEHHSPWADPKMPFHWQFENPRPFRESIPFRRAAGLATLDDDELIRINEALTTAGHEAVSFP